MHNLGQRMAGRARNVPIWLGRSVGRSVPRSPHSLSLSAAGVVFPPRAVGRRGGRYGAVVGWVVQQPNLLMTPTSEWK